MLPCLRGRERIGGGGGGGVKERGEGEWGGGQQTILKYYKP